MHITSSGLGHVGIEDQRPRSWILELFLLLISGLDQWETYGECVGAIGFSLPIFMSDAPCITMFDAFVLKICKSKQVSFQCASHTPHTFQSCTGGLMRVSETQA